MSTKGKIGKENDFDFEDEEETSTKNNNSDDLKKFIIKLQLKMVQFIR